MTPLKRNIALTKVFSFSSFKVTRNWQKINLKDALVVGFYN